MFPCYTLKLHLVLGAVLLLSAASCEESNFKDDAVRRADGGAEPHPESTVSQSAPQAVESGDAGGKRGDEWPVLFGPIDSEPAIEEPGLFIPPNKPEIRPDDLPLPPDVIKPQPPTSDSSQKTVDALQKYRPALAIRSAACLMCHAQVNANTVVDFGYGSPVFLGGRLAKSPFSHWNQPWGATLVGELFVPKATIEPTTLALAAQIMAANPAQAFPMALKDALTVSLRKDDKIFGITQVFAPESFTSFAAALPGIYGKITELGQIDVRPPTPADIRAALMQPDVALMPGTPASFSIGIPAGSYLGAINLTRNYVHLVEKVRCEGDVIIDGVVHMDNVQIQSTTGCRIYATRTVFITGNIGKAADVTVQIASGAAIAMGVRSVSRRHIDYLMSDRPTAADMNIFHRQLDEDRDLVSNLSDDDAGPITVAKDNASGNITAYGWYDPLSATNAVWFDTADRPISQPVCPWFTPVTTSPCVKVWAESYRRKTVEYAGLLLAAPVVHSRYFGRFRGVVITEHALFAVSRFRFEYDPSFEKVDILPRLSVAPFHAQQ